MRRLLVIALLTFTGLHLQGQDLHFSQFYQAPHATNPALTGFFDGTFRAGINYRSQWGSVTRPFVTAAAHTDWSIANGNALGENWFGIGASIDNDVAGDGDLRTSKIMISMAFHKSLAPENRVNLSAGARIGLVGKGINFDKLIFDDQWNGDIFDPNKPTGQTWKTATTSYVDYSIGGQLSFLGDRGRNIILGAALHQLSRSEVTFLNGSTNELAIIPMFHAQSRIPLDYKFDIEPGFIMNFSKGAHEAVFGTNVMYGSNWRSSKKIYAGLWYRTSGDLAAVGGVLFKNIKALISYDINMSKLKVGSHARGGIELSLTYIADWSGRYSDSYCPRFQ